MIRPLACAALALLGASLALPAGAAFRAYVSSSGSDANPCTLPAPCRLLPAAVAAVDDGGEIWMLDSANYNVATVTIGKSVSILAVPGVVGSIVATGGGDGIAVSAPASAKVNLRNLVIVHLGSSQFGINYTSGARLSLVDCEIANMQVGGIWASAGVLTLTRTLLRNNHTATNGSVGLYATGSTTVVADQVQARGNDLAFLVSDGARFTISNSQVLGGANGIWATGDGFPVRVAIENTTLAGVGIAVFARAGGTSSSLVSIERSTIVGGSIGINTVRNGTSTLTLMLSDNTITGQSIASIYFQVPGAVVYSRGNNTMEFSNADFNGGAFTARAAK